MKTKDRYTQLIIELAAWTFFLVMPLILVPSLKSYIPVTLFNKVLTGVILTHSLLIIFYYFNYYYALPRFYFSRRYAIYFPLVISCFIFITLILHTDKGFNPLPPGSVRFAGIYFIFSILLRFIMVFLLSLGLSAYSRLKQAEEEKLKTELAYLKSQVNPHFLFNTLNSIYALTVKKSDMAPESVTRLASIMRYVITEATEDLVPLEKEMNYVSSYIELEKLRLTQKVKLDYSVSGNLQGKRIAPLVFIPLIENAFKHGVSTTEKSAIEIKINTTTNKLTVNVRNTKVRHDKSSNNGLGIENVEKRLELLYSGKHTLIIKETEEDFFVNLELELND